MTKDEAIVKQMIRWVDFLRSQSDNGQHMNIPSSLSAGICWEFANELEHFIQAALVNEALERKAENARELGLDYEPLEAKDEPAPVAKNEKGRITWMIDDWPQNCLLYTTPPQRKPLTDEEERKAFLDWCFSVGLMAQSHGLRSESSDCDTAWKAWQARAAHGIKGKA